MEFPSYKNKKVLILGLGLLGRGINDAIFFAKQGAKVTVTDLKKPEQLQPAIKKLKKYSNIKFVLGRHRRSDVLSADLIVRNAGVPFRSEFVQLALKNKKNIDMDESLFAKYCPCPIIGITGTRGKTTTTMLTYELAMKTKKKVYLAGNIQGKATLPLIKKVKADDLVVLELSSWQLQGFHWARISPHIAVFTNFYPDHLNSYKSMAEYFKDKAYIAKYQTKEDFLILNQDQAIVKKLGQQAKAKVHYFSSKDVPAAWQPKIFGNHNKENIAAAMKVGQILGLTKKQIKQVVENFTGVEHRLHLVRQLRGIKYVNDTTSTTPVAGQKALAAFDQPIVLLAGGAAKNLDLSEFGRDVAKRVKAVVLLEGTATDELEKAIIKFGGQDKIKGRYNNFATAFKQANSLAQKGDMVLLSPGCASFGMFVNEFDRGQQFVNMVKKLK